MPKYLGGVSFRDAHKFNFAMLAKLSQRLLEDLDSLSARILKAVY